MQSADKHFIVMMIPHHDGAIAMAELALTRAKRPEIKNLAFKIQASQRADNAKMIRWYRAWYGTEVPTWPISTSPNKPGMGYGMGIGTGMGGGMWSGMRRGMRLPGMTTSLEILRTAPDFDRAFIEQMIPHHRMGIMMASHALWYTRHPELRALENAMVKAQSQEIAQMEEWHRRWYGA